MCIIVMSDSKPLDLESFKDFHQYNEDGAGIMVARDGKVETFVSLGSPEEVYAKYLTMYKKDEPIFLHYRMKTHGNIDLANTHPYHVYTWPDGRELWMMHNGILATGNKNNPEMSDTWHFIQDRLQGLCEKFPKWYMDTNLLEWLGEFIGNNRFVFLDSDGDSAIVNFDQWTQHDGHLYSNTYAWSSPRQKPPAFAVHHGYSAWGTPSDYALFTPDDLTISGAIHESYAAEINAALPFRAHKVWDGEMVSCLEYYIVPDEFIARLYEGKYTIAQCDEIADLVLFAADDTLADEYLYSLLHGIADDAAEYEMYQ